MAPVRCTKVEEMPWNAGETQLVFELSFASPNTLHKHSSPKTLCKNTGDVDLFSFLISFTTKNASSWGNVFPKHFAAGPSTPGRSRLSEGTWNHPLGFEPFRASEGFLMCRYIGDRKNPTFNRESLLWGPINPYWVDDHPLLYGNSGSLDPGTYDFNAIRCDSNEPRNRHFELGFGWHHQHRHRLLLLSLILRILMHLMVLNWFLFFIIVLSILLLCSS